MKSTIKRIAQLAGVSRGTVDRVLHERGGVNPRTAARVREIAGELDYKTNLVAKSLSAKNLRGSQTIGVLLNSRGNPFYNDIVAGVAAKAAEIADFGFEVRIVELEGYDVERQLRAIDSLAEEGVSGLAVSPINSPAVAAKLRELRDKNIPAVCLNNDVEDAPRLAYVGSDSKRCGHVAAGLFGLLSDGKPQEIAIVAGSFMILGHYQRVQGFRERAKAEFPSFRIVAEAENNDNDLLSYIATKTILNQHPGLSGLFFGAAGIEGGLRAVEEAGMLKKLRVVTVDMIDVVKRQLLAGNVTATICQEPYKQGFEAVRVLFDYLLAGKKPAGDIYTETQIMIRQSI